MANLPKYQTQASVESTHQFVVAFLILTGFGALLVILAGESKNTGNTIAAFLGVMLLGQGLLHVNPLVAFLANHPLVPQQPKSTTLGQAPSTLPVNGGSGGRPMVAE